MCTSDLLSVGAKTQLAALQSVLLVPFITRGSINSGSARIFSLSPGLAPVLAPLSH